MLFDERYNCLAHCGRNSLELSVYVGGVERIIQSWKLTNFRIQQKPPPFFAVVLKFEMFKGIWMVVLLHPACYEHFNVVQYLLISYGG